MQIIFNAISILTTTLISLAVLGFIASYSIALYGSQAHASTKLPAQTKPTHLYLGIVLAILGLSVMFQFTQLSTLLFFIESTLAAIAVNVVFHLIICGLCLWFGVRLIRTSPKQSTSPTQAKKPAGIAVLGFGFFRTFFSVSSVTAVFLANTVIATATDRVTLRILFIGAFLIAAIAPYLLIDRLVKKHPARLQNIAGYLKSFSTKLPIRTIAGWLAISASVLIALIQIVAIIRLFI